MTTELQDIITEQLEGVFKQMDANGFFPGRSCLECGNRLQGQGEGRPAESYAGTYTGLCYPCTGKPPYVTRFFADGAREWSHPPAQPSHRRDRATHLGFNGCVECKGQGRGRDGFCRTCLDRFTGHPLRKKLEQIRKVEATWCRAQQDAFYKKRQKKPRGWVELKERERIVSRHNRFKEHFARWLAGFEERNAEILSGIPWGE